MKIFMQIEKYCTIKGDTNSYVYVIVNKLNGKIYVGSSIKS